MLSVAGSLAAVVGAWFIARWFGRGKPCPLTLAALFDNRSVDRVSGVQVLLNRADVRAGMRVLDAGCGPGRLSIPLARRVGESGEVVALDVQKGMLDRVRRNSVRAGVRNVRTVLGALDENAQVLQYERNAFDRILLVTVLGEIPKPSGALYMLHSVLKPEGILSITETIIDPDYMRRDRVNQLAAEAGFALLQQFGSPLAYTINFRPLK